MTDGPDWRRRAWLLRWRVGPRTASRLRLAVARTTHGHRVSLPGSVYAGPGFRLEIPGAGRLTVGEGVMFRRGFYCEISAGEVVIGPRTTFAADVTIQCSTRVHIGADCLFATSILVADGSHRFRDWSRPIDDQGYDYRPVTIGDGCLVNSHCTVVADVGRHAVIGANSLVNRPVPDYCLAGGVPARLLEYFGPSETRPPGLARDEEPSDR